jgi:hypothetical protein
MRDAQLNVAHTCLKPQQLVSNTRNPPFIERGSLIFVQLCSNGRGVTAIPAVAVAKSPLTQRLGGQHGEEEKSKGGGEEGRKEDEAPEEEVGSRHFKVSDIALMLVTASHGPAAAK